MLLAPDSDCCKIFTAVECELLQRVPLASEAISRIGSTDPAAMLFDAAAAFEEGDPRADEVRAEGVGGGGGPCRGGREAQGRGGWGAALVCCPFFRARAVVACICRKLSMAPVCSRIAGLGMGDARKSPSGQQAEQKFPGWLIVWLVEDSPRHRRGSEAPHASE